MLVIFTANHTYGICLNTVETASFLACSYFFCQNQGFCSYTIVIIKKMFFLL